MQRPVVTTDPEIVQEAAVEAVENAVRFVEDNGFSHAWMNDLSVRFIDAVLYEEDEDDSPETQRERVRTGRWRCRRISRRWWDNPATGPVRQRGGSPRAHRRQLPGMEAAVPRPLLTIQRQSGPMDHHYVNLRGRTVRATRHEIPSRGPRPGRSHRQIARWQSGACRARLGIHRGCRGLWDAGGPESGSWPRNSDEGGNYAPAARCHSLNPQSIAEVT